MEDGRIRRLGVRSDDGWVLVKDRRRTRGVGIDDSKGA